MLVENDIFGKDGVRDKVAIAIERIKSYQPEAGYYLAFSGGKDSIVIKDLAAMAGVKFDSHFHATTVDPPELLRYIKEHHADVEWTRPKIGMFALMAKKKMPPTRISRYCCEKLKEPGGAGRVVLTGVRWAESVRRSRRVMYERCQSDGLKVFLHPIIDWSDAEVWEYIQWRKVTYCSLYDEGWKRIGCIGCPMADRKREFERWPRFERAWKHAIYRCAEARIAAGLPTKDDKWATGEAMWNWWMSDNKRTPEDQCTLFE